MCAALGTPRRMNSEFLTDETGVRWNGMREDGQIPAGAAPLRVMVVDDHDLFRSGLLRLLAEDGLKVVGEARNGQEAVRRALELRPDVIVMDVNMPGMSGVEATRELQTAAPECAVLMLTVNADDDDVLDAILAGAAGYLLKDARLPEIVRAIHAAAAGEALIAPAVTAGGVGRAGRPRAPGAPPPPPPAPAPPPPRARAPPPPRPDKRENRRG